MGIHIRGRPGQGDGIHGGRRRARHEIEAEIQPVGQAAGQRIAQIGVAANGQRQDPSHRASHDPGLLRYREHAERRHGVGHHGQGHEQAGRVAVRFPGRPGQGDGPRGRRRASQGPGIAVEGQPRGQGREGGQRVAHGAAAGGGRQGQGRRGDARDPGLCRDPGHVETRRIIVQARHGDTGRRGNGPVAAHGMGDGGGDVLAVLIVADADGDRLPEVPVRAREDQGRGDGHPRVGWADARGHGRVTLGVGVQHHGIGARAALLDDEGGGLHVHLGRVGLRDVQLDAAGEVSGGDLNEIIETGMRRLSRGPAEDMAEAPAGREGGRASFSG